MNRKHSFLAVLIGLLLTACQADNMYSTSYCNFVFLSNLYPSSALTRAVGSTGGDFCIVKAVVVQGVYHLKLTPNRGTYADTDLDLVMSTAITGERISYAAMGQKQGLIIGRSVYGQLKAYDLQCPNCDFNYELHWGSQPLELVCNKCKRVYNIDGDYGYVKSGEKGVSLAQYKNVVYTPLDGRLVVRN
ncbi:MAG: hypothetical protein J6Z14_11620 [Prevotella sp.]|nr:hypothetical protein [Prevotella sp.]